MHALLIKEKKKCDYIKMKINMRVYMVQFRVMMKASFPIQVEGS